MAAVGMADTHDVSDRMILSPEGEKILMRKSRWSDATGLERDIEQRLIVTGDGGLEYRYELQSEEMQIFHEEFCESKGMSPLMGSGILRGDNAIAGLACGNLELLDADTLEQLPGGGDAGGGPRKSVEKAGPRSIDFAVAQAPNGTASVGHNFRAAGRLNVASSVGGRHWSMVVVDNGRCRFETVKHSNGPFREMSDRFVNCIGMRPANFNTEMSTCIPKLCHSSRGSYMIR